MPEDESKQGGRFLLSEDEIRTIMGGSPTAVTLLSPNSLVFVIERVLREMVDKLARDRENIMALNQVLRSLVEEDIANQDVLEKLKKGMLELQGTR